MTANSLPKTSPDAETYLQDEKAWFDKAIAHPRQSHYVDVEGCQIHYQTWQGFDKNNGKPVLLFVHGGGAHSHWWDFIAPAFVDDYNVLATDLSGMGDSGHREQYSNALYGRELLAVCTDAGYPDDISIISHSFGGFGTLQLALDQPEKLRSIIVTDCTLISRTDRAQMMGQEPPKTESPFGAKKVYADKADALKRFRLVPPQPCDNQYIVDYIAEHSLGDVDGGYSWKFDMGFISKKEHGTLIDDVHQLKCPMVQMYGEDSILFNAGIIDIYEKAYPKGTEFYCLPKAQHHLLLDQPVAYINLLKEIQATLK